LRAFVQLALAGKGKRRAPSIPALIIAATAEFVGLTVLHADEDFDLLASSGS
jgi:predicted nucleic acid-binding protein